MPRNNEAATPVGDNDVFARTIARAALDEAADVPGGTGGAASLDESAFARSVARGADQLQQSLYATGAMFADLLDANDLRAAAEAGIARNASELALNPPRTASLDDVTSPGLALDWLAERLGEQVANIGAMAGSGGLAGIAAKRVAGLLARKYGAEKAAAIMASRLGRLSAEAAGAGAPSYAINAGQTYLETGDAAVSAAAGVPMAALDVAGLGAMLGRLFPAPKQVAENYVKTFLRNALPAAGIAAMAEVPTEVLQEGIQMAAKAYTDPEYDPFAPEELKRLRDAAAAALAVSGTVGGAVGGVTGVAAQMRGDLPASPQAATQAEPQAAAQAEPQAATQAEPPRELTDEDIAKLRAEGRFTLLPVVDFGKVDLPPPLASSQQPQAQQPQAQQPQAQQPQAQQPQAQQLSPAEQLSVAALLGAEPAKQPTGEPEQPVAEPEQPAAEPAKQPAAEQSLTEPEQLALTELLGGKPAQEAASAEPAPEAASAAKQPAAEQPAAEPRSGLQALVAAAKPPPRFAAKEQAKAAQAKWVLAPTKGSKSSFAVRLGRAAKKEGRLLFKPEEQIQPGDTVYLSMPGRGRSFTDEQRNALVTTALDALRRGARLVTDNEASAKRPYNRVGEGLVRKALLEAGAVVEDKGDYAIWRWPQVAEQPAATPAQQPAAAPAEPASVTPEPLADEAAPDARAQMRGITPVADLTPRAEPTEPEAPSGPTLGSRAEGSPMAEQLVRSAAEQLATRLGVSADEVLQMPQGEIRRRLAAADDASGAAPGSEAVVDDRASTGGVVERPATIDVVIDMPKPPGSKAAEPPAALRHAATLLGRNAATSDAGRAWQLRATLPGDAALDEAGAARMLQGLVDAFDAGVRRRTKQRIPVRLPDGSQAAVGLKELQRFGAQLNQELPDLPGTAARTANILSALSWLAARGVQLPRNLGDMRIARNTTLADAQKAMLDAWVSNRDYRNELDDNAYFENLGEYRQADRIAEALNELATQAQDGKISTLPEILRVIDPATEFKNDVERLFGDVAKLRGAIRLGREDAKLALLEQPDEKLLRKWRALAEQDQPLVTELLRAIEAGKLSLATAPKLLRFNPFEQFVVRSALGRMTGAENAYDVVRALRQEDAKPIKASLDDDTDAAIARYERKAELLYNPPDKARADGSEGAVNEAEARTAMDESQARETAMLAGRGAATATPALQAKYVAPKAATSAQWKPAARKRIARLLRKAPKFMTHRLRVIDENELQTFFPNGVDGAGAFRLLDDGTPVVFISRELPALKVDKVLAHELGHVALARTYGLLPKDLRQRILADPELLADAVGAMLRRGQIPMKLGRKAAKKYGLPIGAVDDVAKALAEDAPRLSVLGQALHDALAQYGQLPTNAGQLPNSIGQAEFRPETLSDGVAQALVKLLRSEPAQRLRTTQTYRSGVEMAAGIGTLLKRSWRVVFSSTDARLRQLGLGDVADHFFKPPGEAMRQRPIRAEVDIKAGPLHRRLLERVIPKLEKFSDKELQELSSLLVKQTPRAQIPERYRTVVREVDRLLDRAFQVAVGPESMDYRERKRRGNYFPLILDPAKLETNRAEAIEAAVRSGVARNADEAARLIESLIDNNGVMEVELANEQVFGAGFRHLRKRELFNDPKVIEAFEKFFAHDIVQVLGIYVQGAARTSVYRSRFGLTGEQLRAARAWVAAYLDEQSASPQMTPEQREKLYAFAERMGIPRILERMRKAGIDATLITNPLLKLRLRIEEAPLSDEQKAEVKNRLIPALLGRLGADMSPTLRRAQQWMLLYQNMRLLGLALFSSFVDPGVALWRGESLRDGLAAVRDVLRKQSRKELREAAEDLGVVFNDLIDHYLTDQLGDLATFYNSRVYKLSDKWFRIIGMHSWTNTTRVFALSLGRRFIIRNVAKALAGDQIAVQRLAELGLTVDQARRWVDAGARIADMPHEMRVALHQFIDEGIMRPSAPVKPVWMNDIRFALIAHLKSFIFTFHNTVLKLLWARMKEAYQQSPAMADKMRALVPLATLMVPVMALGMLGYELRREIANLGDAPDEPLDGEWWFEILKRSGMLGYYELLVDMERAGEMGHTPVISALGPTIGQINDFFVRDYETWLPRALPVVPIVPGLRGWMTEELRALSE